MTTVGMLGAFGRRLLRVAPTLAITGQVCVGDDLFHNQREFFTGHCLGHMPIFRRQGDYHSFMDYYLALVCRTSARSRAFFPLYTKDGASASGTPAAFRLATLLLCSRTPSNAFCQLGAVDPLQRKIVVDRVPVTFAMPAS